MTIGRKFAKKDKDRSLSRLLDYRARTVLNTISSEPRGKALGAYLRTGMMRSDGWSLADNGTSNS